MVNLFEDLIESDLNTTAAGPDTTQSCAETGCGGDGPLSILGLELG